MSDVDIWYLGSPHNHPDPEVINRRYTQVCQAAAILHKQGIRVYSPIAHTHAVNEIGGLESPGFEFWTDFDLGMIRRLSGLMILTLDGWRESKGLKAEVKFALDIEATIRLAVPFFTNDVVTDVHVSTVAEIKDVYGL